ncbi:hypothetical protein OG777_30970 [Micromonospora peucetia]|uniref:hypothetical protein n=1 Tax=Micromonospora peucetia TaxID=47871 RepID=UPI00224E84D6|nr:hypothetical protein [Micromonospora peucetia]MCX4391328.1 hypothetical protein [Micromonospora peucetia]
MLRALSRPVAMVQMLSPRSVDTYLQAGDPLQVTVNSYTTPGLVLLAHEDPGTILVDYRLLRQLEADHALFLSA